MPKTGHQDAIDISPSLEVGCPTAGSWPLLVTAGKEGRCHTGHAHPRPVAETSPWKEACKPFRSVREGKGLSGQ